MTKRIVCSGFGGQGILTLGNILAEIGMNKGLNVTWMPSYGAEMRGGTANCSVILSDRIIGSPMVQNKIDILCAMNKPSLDKFLPHVNPGGLVIVNTSIVTEKINPQGITARGLDATNIGVKVGSLKVANMVMLAGLIGDLFTFDDIKSVLEKRFASRPELIALNLKAIQEGQASL